jgi:diaminopimelate epimerase
MPAGGKHHASDGLLIGPFAGADGFHLLIVNTDGTLAERSGNGLTIFCRALADDGLWPASGTATLFVHHDGMREQSPLAVTARADDAGAGRFWLDMGKPSFGPDAVAARDGFTQRDDGTVTVQALAKLNPAWTRSVFTGIGNPHCVTLLNDPAAVPGFDDLGSPVLSPSLTAIAYAQAGGGAGSPCPAGINLQWAAPAGDNHIRAAVFERGEGPTKSSGTSATAVACAARHAGVVTADEVLVEMPGGSLPIRFAADGTAFLLGLAQPCGPGGAGV